MKEFLEKLFSADFMPHGYCYLWNSGLVWLHVVSDVLIALAYFSIPVTLMHFIRKRRDVPFHWMFVSFGMFILACGATHAMEVWTLWHGTYWLSGAIKAVTAIASVPTAILLVQLVPKMLTLPSPEAMRLEIAERKRTEMALHQAKSELELRVLERTADLRNANEDLVTEIAQRKQAEGALRRSQGYLAEAQRLSQTGSWAWHPGTGEISYWSEECYRVLGFEPHEPLPRFETFLQRVHRHDQVATRERFEIAIREKADFELDYRYVHPGRGIRNIHTVGHAILSPSGDLVEFVGTVIDVTEGKRAEEERQQLVDFVPQLIVVLGPDGNWIHANRVAREYTGLTLDEYRSVDLIARVVHPDDAEKMRVARERGLSASDPFDIEARLLGRDGVYRWFLFRYNPLIEEGRVKRWYATGTEIESRKQQEERVRQENVRLEERTRIAQELHDTLLQSFLGASLQLGTAMESIPSDSRVKPKLDRILQLMQQGIEEGRNTIRGLRSSDPRTLDLVLALSAVQRELVVQPNVDFRVSVAGRQQPLRPAVRQEIYRIGREALVNAFCHSQAKRVELEVEYAADSDVRLRVRDNGCGIDPQVLDTGREGHWGLAGMRERATRIGGLLRISSSATAGTEIQLSIPNGVAFQPSPTDP